jgi:lipoprotein NlpI
MRLSVVSVGVALLFVFAGPVPVSRAVADDMTNCVKASGDEAIAACTHIILSRGTPTKSRSAAYVTRGNAYNAESENDHAIADYSEAIVLDPKNMSAYFNRGLANLYSGDIHKALADLTQAAALDPKYAYAALWVDIIGQRNNVPSGLSQAVSTIDMTAWPAPIIRMYLGQTTPAAVLAAANDPDADKKNGQVCEANFYSGELALRTGAKDEATRLFQLAARDCPKGFIEFAAANVELKALGVTP